MMTVSAASMASNLCTHKISWCVHQQNVFNSFREIRMNQKQQRQERDTGKRETGKAIQFERSRGRQSSSTSTNKMAADCSRPLHGPGRKETETTERNLLRAPRCQVSQWLGGSHFYWVRQAWRSQHPQKCWTMEWLPTRQGCRAAVITEQEEGGGRWLC